MHPCGRAVPYVLQPAPGTIAGPSCNMHVSRASAKVVAILGLSILFSILFSPELGYQGKPSSSCGGSWMAQQLNGHRGSRSPDGYRQAILDGVCHLVLQFELKKTMCSVGPS